MIAQLATRVLLASCWVVAVSTLCVAHASANETTPGATKALRALLELSNQPIPKKSSCYGAYVLRGAPTVKDLLAVQLENLSEGTNAIQGDCARSLCSVSITHDGGSEDVASATISFRLNKGKAVLSTLTCVITP
jgi:hypothetical protein